MGKDHSAITKEVSFGFLPVKKNERTFGFWDLLLIQAGIGISSFGLLVGIYTGMLLGAKEAIAAILFGNAIPILLIMPIAILFSRYGVDTFIGFRSALGYRGANILFGLFLLLNLGFITIGCFMSGETITRLFSLFTNNEILTSRSIGAPIFAIVVFLIALSVAYRGPKVIRWFNIIGVPAFLILLVGLIGVLLFGEGLQNVFALQPAAPLESHAKTFATAVEINVGLGFSWLIYLGQYSRLAKTEKIAFSSGFWSYGVLVNVAAILGALGALVVASVIPSDIMTISGRTFEIIGLLLLVAGNITAVVFLLYSQGVSVKTVFPRLRWGLAIATTFPALVLMINPVFYDSYNSFISVVSYAMAILGGMVITDFYFVKKQKISVRDLFNHYGAYTYWKGINPSAIITLIVGTVTYWSLYNPITGESSDLFVTITAGLPTYFVSCISYYVCSKYVFSYEKNMVQEKSDQKIESVGIKISIMKFRFNVEMYGDDKKRKILVFKIGMFLALKNK